jgi:glutathione peroxidase
MTLSLYDIPLRQIDGSPGRLADYRGDVLLVVNIASKCDLTPQYVRLESLYQNKRDTGLGIPGLSANNFNGQGPDSDSEIANVCLANYDVHFPLFSEISVLGEDHILCTRD